MNKSELVRALAEKRGLNLLEAEETLDQILELIAISLACGEPVLISNFGKFEPRQKKEVTRQNPRTGEKIIVPSKLGILFKPSPALKGRINR